MNNSTLLPLALSLFTMLCIFMAITLAWNYSASFRTKLENGSFHLGMLVVMSAVTIITVYGVSANKINSEHSANLEYAFLENRMDIEDRGFVLWSTNSGELEHYRIHSCPGDAVITDQTYAEISIEEAEKASGKLLIFCKKNGLSSDLLSRRLRGMAQETVDLDGIILSEPIFLLKDAPEEVKKDDLKGLRAGESEARDRKKIKLTELIERINRLTGEDNEGSSGVGFVYELAVSMANEENITKQATASKSIEQFMMGDIRDAIPQQVVSSMLSRQTIANSILKDSQNMDDLIRLVAEIMYYPERRETLKELL